MIRLSVLYPSTEGASFDHDYYRDKHVPLAVKNWGLDGAEIDKGLDGPYIAAVHFTFESPEALATAMGAPGPATYWPMWPTTPPSPRSSRPARSWAERRGGSRILRWEARSAKKLAATTCSG